MNTTHHPAITLTQADGKYVVMNSARVCTRCVLPETFPEISFNSEGICSYCIASQGQELVSDDTYRTQLEAALNTADPARSYDCLALYSGGKDSSMALIELRERYGLRVLAFTLDNGYIANATTQNMQRILDSLGIDHVMYRPAKQVMRRVYSISLTEPFDTETTKYSTSACGSCISMVLGGAIEIATEKRIPLLVGGWTPGQFTDSAFLPGGFLVDICSRHFGPLQQRSRELNVALSRYQGEREQHERLPSLFNPLYCTRYDEDEIIAALTARGWIAPEDTDSCSTNCRLNGLLIVRHMMVYGYHPYVYELGHHVRKGYMQRDTALNKLKHINVNVQLAQAVSAEVDVHLPA